MNLSRAKTVLIYTFLALNIFLCYQLWQDRGYDGFTAFGRREEISRLEEAMQKAGLMLETDLPKTTEPASYMIVQPWSCPAQEVIANIWDALEGAEVPDPEITIHFGENNLGGYVFGRYELVINQAGVAILKFAMRDEEIKDHFTKGQAAWKLINNLAFFDDFAHDYNSVTDEGKMFFFRQEYDDFPLFAGYLHYSAANRQGSVQFYRLDVLGFAGQKREIIPPSAALLRFLEVYEGVEEGISIVDFALGYYTREYDAERWEIPPVWRIRLSNGELYYINAFTGNVEI